AVSVRHANRVSVFTRCADSEYARAEDWFFATCSNSTSDAPSSASLIRKIAEAVAPCRTAWRRGNARNAQHTSSATSTRSIPLVTRCVNSITVFKLGERGSTSPLHSGQCLPHPAPAPVARTRAPHRTTATLYPNTLHAYRANQRTEVGVGKFHCRPETRETRDGVEKPLASGGGAPRPGRGAA